MSKIANSVKKRVIERDDYRCQECGIKVQEKSDLPPHFHHKVPRNAGGKTTEGNLITLCGPCHHTKVRHTFRLVTMPVEEYPQFIKWMTREISMNFLAFSERLVGSEFPGALYISDYLEKLKSGMDSVINLAYCCHAAGIGRGELVFPLISKNEAISELEEIINGLKIAWISHEIQRSLDQLIQQATERKTYI